MADTRDALIAITDSIETELKRIGLWSGACPNREALNSEQPFCYDTLKFNSWIQWVFLPRMREALHAKRDMPERSNIHAYAEEVLKSTQDVDQLLFLIKTFDELVAASSSALLPAVHQSSSKKLLS